MKITFNGSPGPTLGAELELQIIDPETKDLVSGGPRIIERSQDETPELLNHATHPHTQTLVRRARRAKGA